MPERISVSLNLTPCWTLASLLLALHLTAAFAALRLDLPLWLRAGIIVPIVLAAFDSLRRHALLSSAQACLWLQIRDDGQCRWQLRAGSEHTGTLLPHWFTSPWLTVLRIKNGQSRTIGLLLTPCKVDAEAHRRLRIMLANRV